MKVIIYLGGDGQQMRPQTWSRPQPLLNVAGNTVLGHMLNLMRTVTTGEVIFVTYDRPDQIQSWVQEHYPDLAARFVVQEEARGPAHAVWLCRDYLENDPADLLITTSYGLIDADYSRLAELATERDAAAILYVQEQEDARHFIVADVDDAGTITHLNNHPQAVTGRQVLVGLTYFQNGHQLLQHVDRVLHHEPQNSSTGNQLLAVFNLMMDQGQRLIIRPVRQWSDTSDPQALLATNARMLAIGYHSAEAIERSYAEEFLVVPPVYLHPDATVQNAVVGPYATIGAGAVVKDAIVRHCIIDAGAEIQHCILEQALVGENARVTGRASNLFTGDQAIVQL